MKAKLNKNLTFDCEYINDVLRQKLGMSHVMAEFNCTANDVEKRIKKIFEIEPIRKIAALHVNDKMTKEKDAILKDVSKASRKGLTPGINIEAVTDNVSLPSSSTKLSYIIPPLPEETKEAESKEIALEEIDDLLSSLSDSFLDSASKATEQLRAEEAVGSLRLKEVDSSASRNELKRLNKKIEDAEKVVSSARSDLMSAEVNETTAREKLERAKESLRKAELNAKAAVHDLELARSTLEREKSSLEDLRKKRDSVQKELDNMALPTFKIVPFEDHIVLNAYNYDIIKGERLDLSIKWSRKIGEKFVGLTDSEFMTMGRLFGMLTGLHGKYNLEIDPSLIRVNEVYQAFKHCFK